MFSRNALPKNHARIEESKLPDLLRKIEAYQGTPSTRFAMKLLALTFVRTSELIEARWSEINSISTLPNGGYLLNA